MNETFSELAITKLLQIFPELSSLIVSFKDLTEEVSSLDETDVSVGVFILQSGGKYFYLPIVAKGEVIQPLDSVFDNEEQCFIPLTKGFVTRLINSGQSEMGKPTKIPNTVSQNPSIYSLVTPPRTGKFVYASSSKLEEFLSILPNMTKKAVLDEFSSDKDIYSALHKLFGLENIVSALKPSIAPVVAVPKPAIELITEGSGLGNPEIQSILSKGYALRGENQTTRVAVRANEYADGSNKLMELSSADAGQDFDLATISGVAKTAYIPKYSKYHQQKPALLRHRGTVDNLFAIFSDGSFTTSKQLIAIGQGRDGKKTLKEYFSNIPPITPSGLTNSTYFVLFSPDLELIDVYDYPSVIKTEYGVTIRAYSLTSFGNENGKVTINAFKNCKTIDTSDPANIFIPYDTLVGVLGKRVYAEEEFETNINAAANRLELTGLSALGSAINIAHDGVEFILNRSPVGSEASIMKILVVDEGIDPAKAETFIKQAKESKNRNVTVYLSKKADAEQDIIPSYGDAPPMQQPGFGINDEFTNNVSQAAKTNDAEVVETTIISELLNVAEMKGYIKEYLPDIKNSLDKIGRALFLCRLRMDQLALSHTAAEVFSFVANLRNTYRNLGDTYLKLENMVADSELGTQEK